MLVPVVTGAAEVVHRGLTNRWRLLDACGSWQELHSPSLIGWCFNSDFSWRAMVSAWHSPQSVSIGLRSSPFCGEAWGAWQWRTPLRRTSASEYVSSRKLVEGVVVTPLQSSKARLLGLERFGEFGSRCTVAHFVCHRLVEIVIKQTGAVRSRAGRGRWMQRACDRVVHVLAKEGGRRRIVATGAGFGTALPSSAPRVAEACASWQVRQSWSPAYAGTWRRPAAGEFLVTAETELAAGLHQVVLVRRMCGS